MFGHPLGNLNQPWLSTDNLIKFVDGIHAKGAALNNTWGLIINCTVRLISQPRIHQRIVYNGHKRQHILKCQSIATLNGMIENLYRPLEGKHDVEK